MIQHVLVILQRILNNQKIVSVWQKGAPKSFISCIWLAHSILIFLFCLSILKCFYRLLICIATFILFKMVLVLSFDNDSAFLKQYPFGSRRIPARVYYRV